MARLPVRRVFGGRPSSRYLQPFQLYGNGCMVCRHHNTLWSNTLLPFDRQICHFVEATESSQPPRERVPHGYPVQRHADASHERHQRHEWQCGWLGLRRVDSARFDERAARGGAANTADPGTHVSGAPASESNQAWETLEEGRGKGEGGRGGTREWGRGNARRRTSCDVWDSLNPQPSSPLFPLPSSLFPCHAVSAARA